MSKDPLALQIALRDPWLIVAFPQNMQSLGWTPQSPGQSVTRAVLWRAVRDADLCEDFDVLPWLAQETAALGHLDAPCFLTSAQLAQFQTAEAQIDGYRTKVVVTLGLGNAERIGSRRDLAAKIGTINALLVTDVALSPGAALEALSLLAEARTTAMLEFAPKLWDRAVTGTGTDCLCLCAPLQGEAQIYAGKHTALGEAIGQAALHAFTAAVQAWVAPQ